MQALTKKHHTEESALVSLMFRVHPDNVDRIKRYVAKIEPAIDASSVSLDEFYRKHFDGLAKPAVTLQGLRYRENMTQKQLAEATGIPQRHISEMENGKRTIGKENARKLADVLNTDYRLFL